MGCIGHRGAHGKTRQQRLTHDPRQARASPTPGSSKSRAHPEHIPSKASGPLSVAQRYRPIGAQGTKCTLSLCTTDSKGEVDVPREEYNLSEQDAQVQRPGWGTSSRTKLWVRGAAVSQTASSTLHFVWPHPECAPEWTSIRAPVRRLCLRYLERVGGKPCALAGAAHPSSFVAEFVGTLPSPPSHQTSHQTVLGMRHSAGAPSAQPSKPSSSGRGQPVG